MFKKFFHKTHNNSKIEHSLYLYELKSEIVFLEGLVGCGKTHFVNNIVKKMGASNLQNSNFMLFDGRGERGELADVLLEYGYNVFVINKNTEGKFVFMKKTNGNLDVSIYENDNDEVWQSLKTKPKTAIVAGHLDNGQLVSIINKGMDRILKNDICKDINLVAIFENIDFVINQDSDGNEDEETFGLVSELLQKYNKNQLEHIQTVFSFQELSHLSIFKEFMDSENKYQYIRFDRGTSSSGSECFTACEKIASTKAKMICK